MCRIVLEIRRPNGETEIVDQSQKWIGMSKDLLAKIRKATKDAGRGDVIRAIEYRDAVRMEKTIKTEGWEEREKTNKAMGYGTNPYVKTVWEEVPAQTIEYV